MPGSSFHVLQATSQALQPMHTLVSVKNPYARPGVISISEPHHVGSDLRQAVLGRVQVQRQRRQFVDLRHGPRVPAQVDVDQVAVAAAAGLDPQVREGRVAAVAPLTTCSRAAARRRRSAGRRGSRRRTHRRCWRTARCGGTARTAGAGAAVGQLVSGVGAEAELRQPATARAVPRPGGVAASVGVRPAPSRRQRATQRRPRQVALDRRQLVAARARRPAAARRRRDRRSASPISCSTNGCGAGFGGRRHHARQHPLAPTRPRRQRRGVRPRSVRAAAHDSSQTSSSAR